MTIIQVRNLVRDYVSSRGFFRKRKEEIRALDGISFDVEEGEIFGLVGPNAAGKTTTIKILATLLTPTQGSAEVLGFDVTEHPQQIRKQIGLMFGGERGLYYRLSGKDNLKYFGMLYGLKSDFAAKRSNDLLEIVGLSEKDADRKVQTYSRGMKQRLHIARALLHDPKLVFFDEPTIGLDPVTAREIRERIQNLSREAGKTIFMTTHYMFEADQLCGRVAIIKKGKILKIGSPREIKQDAENLSVAEFEAVGLKQEHVSEILKVVSVKTASVVEYEGKQKLTIYFDSKSNIMPDVLRILNTVLINRVTTNEPTLEDAYVYLINKGERRETQ